MSPCYPYFHIQGMGPGQIGGVHAKLMCIGGGCWTMPFL